MDIVTDMPVSCRAVLLERRWVLLKIPRCDIDGVLIEREIKVLMAQGAIQRGVVSAAMEVVNCGDV